MGKSMDAADQRILSKVISSRSESDIVDVYDVAHQIAAEITDRSLSDIIREVEQIVIATGGSAVWTTRTPASGDLPTDDGSLDPTKDSQLRHARAL